jgi:DNA-binding NarL/FixJ family response regulator
MKNILVFILDRNPVQGNFLKYSLSSSGIRNIIIFHSPEECVNNIRKTMLPEFIIADAVLKSMTDLEFLKLIKNIDPSIKVIFYSDNEDISHISKLLDIGATDYIVRIGGNRNWIRELTSNLQYIIKEELRSG